MTKEALKMALNALENNRQTHHYCEDTWYSCPKHEDGCANEAEGAECNCGADEINAQFDKAITAIKEALAQPEQEPVEYQMRMRPTWEVTSFSDWKKCSRDAFDDYTKTPKLHDWEYEVRKLYTTPPQRTWVGLTDEEKPQ